IYRSSKENANEIVSHIKNHGGSAIAVPADVFETEGCEKLVEETIKQFGQIDICIIGPGAGWHPESIEKLNTAGALEDTHNELAPIYNLMPLVLPGMYKQKWGRIIAISLMPPYNCPSYSYNVGKAARTNAMFLARDEAWKNGVTLNIIGPGPVSAIETLKEAIDQCNREKKWIERQNVSPQDIAEGIAFLCSESGRYISGCVLPYM
ncbi:MAG: SDR family oxidoreductase, partial [bacterium]